MSEWVAAGDILAVVVEWQALFLERERRQAFRERWASIVEKGRRIGLDDTAFLPAVQRQLRWSGLPSGNDLIE